ncbi:MAG TPA: CAP domain-containing protein [Anaerolineales bacterium]|nr:CAP domain-containing protein [Anaerolineales bacterium]
MSRRASFLLGVIALAAFAALHSTSVSRAESQGQPDFAGSPFDLVNAVNSLRLSYGLAPYSISTILMATAQGQADFLAATGSMTHTGPGGISVTDRLLAAGYPLAGDLSLGGFRSENITGGRESMSAQAAVNAWTGDSLHLNTMISPNLTEIGAGVAVSNGRVYYVIDCALPTTSGAPQAMVTSVGSGSAVPASEAAVIVSVALSTPNPDGDVIHEVKAGQSLWQIAIAYKVKIDEIKSMNGLSGNDIYPGNKLLIKRGALAPTASLTEAPTQALTSTSTSAPMPTATHDFILTSTAVVLASSASTTNSLVMKAAIGLIAFALVGGGIFAWLGGSKKGSSRQNIQNGE